MSTDELVRALIAGEVRERLDRRRSHGPKRPSTSEVDGLVDDYLNDIALVPTTRTELHQAARAVLARIDADN